MQKDGKMVWGSNVFSQDFEKKFFPHSRVRFPVPKQVFRYPCRPDMIAVFSDSISESLLLSSVSNAHFPNTAPSARSLSLKKAHINTKCTLGVAFFPLFRHKAKCRN